MQKHCHVIHLFIIPLFILIVALSDAPIAVGQAKSSKSATTSGPAVAGNAPVTIPLPLIPENVEDTREALKLIESQLNQDGDERARWLHELRLQYYGSLILKNAEQGNWDANDVRNAAIAFEDAQKFGLSRIEPGLVGVSNIVDACKMTKRDIEAIEWQRRLVLGREAVAPERCDSHLQLAALLESAGNRDEAVRVLFDSISKPLITPDEYVVVVLRLFRLGEGRSAWTLFEKGVSTYEKRVADVEKRWASARVFVNPALCPDVPRYLWFELCKPVVVALSEKSKIDELNQAGYLDITNEVRSHEKENADTAVKRMKTLENAYRERLKTALEQGKS